MKAQEIKDRLASCGWTEDRFGHMKKDLSVTDKATKIPRMVEHRMKFQKISVRFEQAVISQVGPKEWFLRTSMYMKDVKLDDTGALAIGRYRFKPAM